MSAFEELVEIATAELEQLRHLVLGDFGTAGPDVHPAELVHVDHPPSPDFVDGYYVHAQRLTAHPGRIGGPIQPYSTGLHTTDMLPKEWEALKIAWTTRAGDGACATVAIGQTPAQGVVQFVPVTRNANHLGGDGHGVFVVDGQRIHPNLVTNGIEVHCAGGVRRVEGQWRLVEAGKAHGEPIPDGDVIPDPVRPGRGIARVTDYQYDELTKLLAALDKIQRPLPHGVYTMSFDEQPPAWALGCSLRVVPHVRMDPKHRSDPWKPTLDWLRARNPS